MSKTRSIFAVGKQLGYEQQALNDPFFAAGIAKSCENCFEYAWKAMKQVVTGHGIEAYSPRDIIKAAGRVGLVSEVEEWLGFLENRNLSVHDYLGIEDEDYLITIKKFLGAAKQLESQIRTTS